LEPFESVLEFHYALQTDAFTFDLVQMDAQPLALKYWYDGKYRTWTPDFLVRRRGRNRALLSEVKSYGFLYPEDAQKRAWIRGKFQAIAKAASDAAPGYDFSLFTEREIWIQPRLHNAELMMTAVYRGYPEELCNAGRTAVLTLPHSSDLSELQTALGARYDALDIALHLAWRGEIVLDPSVKWSRTTAFRRSSRSLS
jgi:hypothetical protein